MSDSNPRNEPNLPAAISKQGNRLDAAVANLPPEQQQAPELAYFRFTNASALPVHLALSTAGVILVTARMTCLPGICRARMGIGNSRW